MPYKQRAVRNSKVVCPKCKSKNLGLIEVWNGASTQWIQENGSFDMNGGSLGADNGSPVKVTAECSGCNHRWTVKNAVMIQDIIIDKTKINSHE